MEKKTAPSERDAEVGQPDHIRVYQSLILHATADFFEGYAGGVRKGL